MPLNHDPAWRQVSLSMEAFDHVAGHIVQGKQAVILCTSSGWPHAISLALFRLMAPFLDEVLHVP